MLSTRQKGNDAEDRASSWLKEKGYTILQRNFRTRGGEIDIIALKGQHLTFFEVKSLPHGTIETLAHELNSRKQEKIIKTAKCYLQKHREYSNRYIHFDVLALDLPVLDPVYHIENAFTE
ncbi:YraN family protein [Treponema sp.]|uniref:YraN family protein n=1 Tax=Treponema sp. TaxID=166 RepID=UPI0025F40B03|nr:YraN family protein [Treponema sp.]MCR5218152.1 YraN family protein [Treponema sp.]